MNTLGQCVKTESGVSSPECVSAPSLLYSLRAHFVFAPEFAPGFIMAVGSYRWFVSGFVLRGLHTWVLSVQQILIEIPPCAKNHLRHCGGRGVGGLGNSREQNGKISPLPDADILVGVFISQFTCKLF